MPRCGVPEGGWEDCVQETWFALLQEPPDWALDDLRTWRWLRHVARNQARNARRREQRHRRVSQDEQAFILDAAADPFPPDDQEADPATPLSLRVARIWDVLNELPEINRRIFILHALDGLTHAEIGEAPRPHSGRGQETLQTRGRQGEEPTHVPIHAWLCKLTHWGAG